MRRVLRKGLDAATETYLENKQKIVDRDQRNNSLQVDNLWNNARQTKKMEIVLTTLQGMMGPRQRCMYCCDSHGSDIEHFRPKSDFAAHMFLWSNLLLCCTPCGRIKGTKFPMADDQCLLIDPSMEEPWEFLDFDPDTGNITARYDHKADAFFIKGDRTVATLRLDQREALANGYRKTHKELCGLIVEYLKNPGISNILITNLVDKDEHGLLGWFFKGNGQFEDPARQLHEKHVNVWRDCCEEFKYR